MRGFGAFGVRQPNRVWKRRNDASSPRWHQDCKGDDFPYEGYTPAVDGHVLSSLLETVPDHGYQGDEDMRFRGKKVFLRLGKEKTGYIGFAGMKVMIAVMLKENSKVINAEMVSSSSSVQACVSLVITEPYLKARRRLERSRRNLFFGLEGVLRRCLEDPAEDAVCNAFHFVVSDRGGADGSGEGG